MAKQSDPGLAALAAALQALTAAGTVPQIAERLAVASAGLLAADGAEVRILDGEGLRLIGGHGLRQSPPRDVLDAPHGLAGQAMRRGTPLATGDYLGDTDVPRDADDWARAEGIMSAIVVPLPATDVPVAGVLLAFRRQARPFPPVSMAALVALAATGHLALSSARLAETARSMAAAVHGFNNLFAITLLRAEMLLELEPETDGSGRRESLDAIRRVALEGRELVRQARPARPASPVSGSAPEPRR
jgi:hypothetical protein